MDVAEFACGAHSAIDWAAWSAVGTILAAIATIAAVVVALASSKKAYAQAMRLRNDQWERDDLAKRSRAAVLAHTFGRELLQASVPLMLLYNHVLAVMQGRLPGGVDLAIEVLILPSETSRHLSMMTRLAHQLDGFSDHQAVSILNALSAWKNINESFSKDFRTTTDGAKVHLVAQRLIDIDLTLELFRDLQASLKEDAGRLGFLDERTMENVRDDARERRNGLIAGFSTQNRAAANAPPPA